MLNRTSRRFSLAVISGWAATVVMLSGSQVANEIDLIKPMVFHDQTSHNSTGVGIRVVRVFLLLIQILMVH